MLRLAVSLVAHPYLLRCMSLELAEAGVATLGLPHPQLR
jgi:hypothetical protein